MYKFGLIKEDGVFNETSTDVFYNHTFFGYKPVQSFDIFGLINSTDGNFWLVSEDDDHYWTTAKISEETIRDIHTKLKNNDLSDSNIFKLENDLVSMNILNLQNNRLFTQKFHKDWIPQLIKTLDIDNPKKTKKDILPIWDKSIVPDRIDYPLMSLEEYIYNTISKYPTLYANKDFEISKFNVLDHFLNTISSGFDKDEDFFDTLSKKENIDIEKIKRLCIESSYTGFSKVDSINLETRVLNTPVQSSKIVENIFEEDKDKYPNVIYWQKNDPTKEFDLQDIMNQRKGLKIESKFSPYPNFQKEYSLVWINKDLLNNLDNEWIEGFKWFYEKSLESIDKGCFKDHSEFPTGSTKEDSNRIKQFENIIKNESFKKVSRDYGMEYNGNVEEFLTNQWLKTKDEYKTFINETINVLNDILDKNISYDFER